MVVFHCSRMNKKDRITRRNAVKLAKMHTRSSLKFTEQPGKPRTLIPEGMELTLSGNEEARDRLKIELNMTLHSIDSVGNPDQSKLHAVVNMLPGQAPGLVGSLPICDEKKELWLLLDASRFINE